MKLYVLDADPEDGRDFMKPGTSRIYWKNRCVFNLRSDEVNETSRRILDKPDAPYTDLLPRRSGVGFASEGEVVRYLSIVESGGMEWVVIQKDCPV